MQKTYIPLLLVISTGLLAIQGVPVVVCKLISQVQCGYLMTYRKV
jgi:hypothetical protein